MKFRTSGRRNAFLRRYGVLEPKSRALIWMFKARISRNRFWSRFRNNEANERYDGFCSIVSASSGRIVYRGLSDDRCAGTVVIIIGPAPISAPDARAQCQNGSDSVRIAVNLRRDKSSGRGHTMCARRRHDCPFGLLFSEYTRIFFFSRTRALFVYILWGFCSRELSERDWT